MFPFCVLALIITQNLTGDKTIALAEGPIVTIKHIQ